MSGRESRRDFVKKAAYLAPAIVTLAAAPAYSRVGSVKIDDPLRPPVPRPTPRKPGG